MAYKFYFLINPISGGGQGKIIKEFLPEIMDSMDFSSEDWKVEFTRYEGMKEQILEACDKRTIPVIASLGRKGGSTVCAAIVNALFYGIQDEPQDEP